MPRIMLIGRDRERTSGIKSLLRQDGHQVSLVRAIEGWRAREEQLQPDLVIAAVNSTESVLADGGRQACGFPPPLLFAQHGADFYRNIDLDERLVDRIASQHRPGSALRVQVLHSHNPEGAALLRGLIDQHFDCTWLPVGPMSLVLGAHTGPSMVGVAYAPLAAFADVP